MNEHLPETLYRPLAEAIRLRDKGDWYRSMIHLLDFLETGAAYASIVLLGLFRKESLKEGLPAPQPVLEAVNRIDMKRPLSFGDWVNSILTPLALEASKSFPDNPFVKNLSNAISNRRNVFIGRKEEKSLVQIRNDYKGHATLLSDKVYQPVVEILFPRAIQFAEALDGIQSCGLDLPGDLFPLIHRTEEGHEYVFQTLKEEQVSFLSTDENALPVHTDVLNHAFDRWMQCLLPSFDIAKDLNWAELTAIMKTESEAYMADIYSQRKYNREIFVERGKMNEAFREFLDSPAPIFPLQGDAGQGKTNQLCYWTETLLENGNAVLIFAGSSFSKTALELRLRKLFGLSRRKNTADYLERINLLAQEHGRKVYVFFDAVNEAIHYPGLTQEKTGPVLLYEDILRLFGKKSLSSFKVLLTCRNYTWHNELLPIHSKQDPSLFFDPEDESLSSIRGFTDDEVEQAYRVYGELFQMETPFDKLQRGYVLRLKDPLMLKIACTSYLGQELPSGQNCYTSLSLFERMMDCIAHSYAGKNQVRIIRGLSDSLLDRYEKGEAADSVLVKDLRHALGDPGDPLHPTAELLYKKDGITIAFAELLNKPERPVLRMAEGDKIQFIYERFLEFLLSKAYLARHPSPDAETVYGTLKTAAVNEVFLGSMRSVLISHYQETGRTDLLLDLLKKHGDDFEVLSLVSGVLDVLVREIYLREIFDVERNLLSWKESGIEETVTEFNAVCRTIDTNKADDAVIARHKELMVRLSPMIRIRNLAGVTLINGMLLSDAYNEGLYTEDPFPLLWTLLDDPVTEVKNNACMQAYYAAGKKTTLNGMPLRENVTEGIIRRMFDFLERRSIVGLVATSRRRVRTVTFLETAVRLDVLLIIDSLLKGGPDDRQKVSSLLEEIRGIFRHVTANHALIRMLLPFFNWILQRQITFQSAYVNNLTEYSAFWKVIPRHPDESGSWCRDDITGLAPFAFLYSRYYGPDAPCPKEEAPDFTKFGPRIVAAYQTGDSLSYFLLERLQVIVGVSSGNLIRPVLEEIDRTIPGTEWYDYSQMSFIYVLYQLGLKMEQFPEDFERLLERNCEDWTRRCRGYFSARNSRQANPLQLYKRNVLSWYAMVWCTRHGDCSDPDGNSVPLFRKLLKEAVDNRDKELLVHLVNNILELVTDSGHINTALDLMKDLFRSIPSQEVLDSFREKEDERYPDTKADLIALCGNILGNAKNAFPAKVNEFLARDIVGLGFPGIPKYKEDILNYNPGGEKLSDLFTHKFGNFIIWALVHEESVDQVVADCLCEAAAATDSAAWFKKAVRIVLQALLKIKI